MQKYKRSLLTELRDKGIIYYAEPYLSARYQYE